MPIKGLYHPLDGATNPKQKLLHFLTTIIFYEEKKALAFIPDRFCHIALCLWLILFHLVFFCLTTVLATFYNNWANFPCWPKTVLATFYNNWANFPCWPITVLATFYNNWANFPCWPKTVLATFYYNWANFPFWPKTVLATFYNNWANFPCWPTTVLVTIYNNWANFPCWPTVVAQWLNTCHIILRSGVPFHVPLLAVVEKFVKKMIN